MGIRLQPKEIEVPRDKPFKYDLLDRKASVEALSAIIRANEGPGVVAVDAGWGMGKTTFLKMLVAHLRQTDFPAVVHFNAWETDFADSPFLALTAEIIDGLSEKEEARAKIKHATAEVLRSIPGMLIRVASSAVPLVGSQALDEYKAMTDSLTEDFTSPFREAKASIESFKETLEKSAKEVSEDGKPLVIVIDELDRCRPSYAVELLEVAKHFFSVDHVVFVLALDRSQLAHSVKVLYGDGFAAENYLGRFFDADLRLPIPDRTIFINSLVKATGIKDYLDKGRSPGNFSPEPAVYTVLPLYLTGSDLDLRSIAQVIHRLGIAIASLEESMFRFVPTLVTLLIMRSLAPGPYRDYIYGRATDEETIMALLDTPGGKAVLDSDLGNWVEALILIARLGPRWDPARPLGELSPRLQRYKDAVNAVQQYAPRGDMGMPKAERIIKCVKSMTELIPPGFSPISPVDQIGYELCFRRIELLEFDDQSSVTQAP